MLALLDQGSTVPLLLHYSVAVLIVISTIDVTYLGQMRRSVTVTSSRVLAFCSGVRAGLG